jgi:hypothetical protein
MSPHWLMKTKDIVEQRAHAASLKGQAGAMREALSVGAPGCLHATDWTTYHETRLVTNCSWRGSLNFAGSLPDPGCIGVSKPKKGSKKT